MPELSVTTYQILGLDFSKKDVQEVLKSARGITKSQRTFEFEGQEEWEYPPHSLPDPLEDPLVIDNNDTNSGTDEVLIPKVFTDLEEAKEALREYAEEFDTEGLYLVLYKNEESHNVAEEHVVQLGGVINVERSLKNQFYAWYMDAQDYETESEIEAYTDYFWSDSDSWIEKEVPYDVRKIAKQYRIDLDDSLITPQGDYHIWRVQEDVDRDEEMERSEFLDQWRSDPYKSAWLIDEFSWLKKDQTLTDLPRTLRWGKTISVDVYLGLETEKFIEELLENDAPHSVVVHAWEELGKPDDWTDEEVKSRLQDSIEWDKRHDVDWEEVLDKTQTELDEEERKRLYAPKQRTFASMYGEPHPRRDEIDAISVSSRDMFTPRDREYRFEVEPEAFATMDDFEHPYEVREKLGKAIGGFGKALGDLLSVKEKKLQKASLDAISQRFANLEISEDAEQLLLGLLDLQDDTSRRFALLELSDGVPVLVEGESKSDEHEATRMRGALLELEEAYMDASDYEKWKMQDNLVQNFAAIADEILRKEKAKWNLLGVGEPGEAGYYIEDRGNTKAFYGPFEDKKVATKTGMYYLAADIPIVGGWIRHFTRAETAKKDVNHPMSMKHWDADPTPLFLEAAANEAAAQVLEEEHPVSIRGKLIQEELELEERSTAAKRSMHEWPDENEYQLFREGHNIAAIKDYRARAGETLQGAQIAFEEKAINRVESFVNRYTGELEDLWIVVTHILQSHDLRLQTRATPEDKEMLLGAISVYSNRVPALGLRKAKFWEDIRTGWDILAELD